eukprot:TRINITY_DN65602_c0_g1_i1.p1 TRINITY_DN65602_c0_g1~~TRINITY_DN65602_c0_g1_i1.p1  ORF type:complete len:501 (+),score=121.79 TRINITY_DN65602_c0_g1_i1:200-1702(+)
MPPPLQTSVGVATVAVCGMILFQMGHTSSFFSSPGGAMPQAMPQKQQKQHAEEESHTSGGHTASTTDLHLAQPGGGVGDKGGPSHPLHEVSADSERDPMPSTGGIHPASVPPVFDLERDGLPQSCKINQKFEAFVRRYVAAHNAGRSASASPHGRGRFVYSCEPHKRRFCGGTGDRLRGVTTSLFLAMASSRDFRLYSPFPAPYSVFYDSAYLDWGIAEAEADAIPVDLSLMRLNKHKHYMKVLSRTPPGASVRVQSNSFDVTPYAFGEAKLRQGMEEMGVGRCNISCYYACMFDLLFTPNKEARGMIAETVGERKSFIGMQVRVSGPWAVGLQVPEKWRTHPAAFPHFWSELDALFAEERFKDAHLFITTDAPKFLSLVKERYGKRVFLTPGEQFNHTDSSELHNLRPDKYKVFDTATQKVSKYRLTLLNNYILGMSGAMVMAQSGFGDTAFWRTKKIAKCLFVDISNYRTLWKHTLEYPDPGGSVAMTHNQIIHIAPP